MMTGHVATRELATFGQDRAGSTQRTYTASGTVNGRFRAVSGSKNKLYEREGSRVTHVFNCLVDPGVQRQDRLVWNNVRYEVQFVITRNYTPQGSDLPPYWGVAVEEITQRQAAGSY